MFDLVDYMPMNLNLPQNMENQSTVAVFLYTAISNPEVSEINKQIRNMTKINAASNTAKPSIRTWKL